jgi:molybdopterin converting factor small subunit
MSVRVRIFYPALQRLLDDSDEVTCAGRTVGECLADLTHRHPGVEELLFDTRGRLLPPVYVFINMEGMFKAELTKAVTDSDELILAVLASGG